MGRYPNISTYINYTTSDTEDGGEGGGNKMTAINVYKIRNYQCACAWGHFLDTY